MQQLNLFLCIMGWSLWTINCTSFHDSSTDYLSEVDKLVNKGKLYENMNRPDSAYIYYQEAISLLQHHEANEKLIDLYCTIGEILYKHGDYEYAKMEYRKAISHACFTDNKSLLSKFYRMLGKVYGFQKQFDSTLHYYQLAHCLWKQVSQQERADIMNNLSAIYLRMGKLDSALHYNTMALEFNVEKNLRGYDWYARAQIFERYERLDSTVFYLKQLIEDGDAKFKTLGYYHLMNISSQLNDVDSVSYLRNYIYWKDSLDRIDQTVNVANSKLLVEKKRMDKYYQMEKEKYILFFSGLTALTGIIIWFAMSYRKKIIQEEMFLLKENLLKKEKSLHEMENQIFNLQQSNKEKDDELHDLQTAYDKNKHALQKDAEILSLNLHKKGEIISKRLMRLRKFKDCRKRLELAVKDTHHPFTSKDADELFACIFAEFGSYIMDLKYFSLFKKEDDYIYTCTFYIDFSPKEYQLLYHVEDNSIRMKRRRLKEKMEGSIIGNELAKLLFAS